MGGSGVPLASWKCFFWGQSSLDFLMLFQPGLSVKRQISSFVGLVGWHLFWLNCGSGGWCEGCFEE